jgi:hypothetical protein
MPKSRPPGNDPPPPGRPPSGGDPENIRAAQEHTEIVLLHGHPGAERSESNAAPGTSGPPWPVAGTVTGSARGRDLNPPHRRHTVAGASNGQIQEQNTVYLRGYEGVAAQDVPAIASGEATWNPNIQRYEINGRSYGVEPNGTVFPDSGAGMVKLDRNEYAALKEISRAGGDLSAAPQLSRNPRFTANPAAVAKAKAIYDGTYEP